MPIVVGHDPSFGLVGQAAVAGGQASYGMEQARFLAQLQEEERQRQFQAYQSNLNRQQEVGLALLHGQIQSNIYGQRIGNQRDMLGLREGYIDNRFNQRLDAQGNQIQQRADLGLRNRLAAKPIGYDEMGRPMFGDGAQGMNGAPPQPPPPFDEQMIQGAMQGDPQAIKTASQHGWIIPTDAQKQMGMIEQRIHSDNTLSDGEKQHALQQAQSQPMWQAAPPANRRPTTQEAFEQETAIAAPAVTGDDGNPVPGTEQRIARDRNGTWRVVPNEDRKIALNMQRDAAKAKAQAEQHTAEQAAKAAAHGNEMAEKERQHLHDMELKRNEADVKLYATRRQNAIDELTAQAKAKMPKPAEGVTATEPSPPSEDAIHERIYQHIRSQRQIEQRLRDDEANGGQQPNGQSAQPQSAPAANPHPELKPNAPPEAVNAADTLQGVVKQYGSDYSKWPPDVQAAARQLKAVVKPHLN